MPCHHRHGRSTGRRVRPGDDRAGHQADRRVETYVAGGACVTRRARPTASLPPGPAGRELAGLPEPLRLITDAHSMATTTSTHRPRAPGEVFEGLIASRPVSAARWPRLSKSTTGTWPARRRHVPRNLRQGPLLPGDAGPRPARPAGPEPQAASPRPESGSIWWSPTICTTSAVSSTTRTTCCYALAPATTRHAGRMRFGSSEFYLKSAAEMAALFPDNLDAIRRTAPSPRWSR